MSWKAIFTCDHIQEIQFQVKTVFTTAWYQVESKRVSKLGTCAKPSSYHVATESSNYRYENYFFICSEIRRGNLYFNKVKFKK